ncbi:Peptidyl-prolyl cis-trans isomerase-like 3 [Capsicum annuum]|uniref:Peptidyl-prolyl cis-trans isomerase-like 3 n=1 Tax=Capsicum annuum TaxID=4072 RepID=A0A2G2Y0K0_CAPAN|nr:Peptidyl-prolyl cis-trans isomerase-like 3 [Capsicum annuum]
MTLADMCIEPGKPWEYCPREVFRKVVKILKDEFDLVVNVGFEIEFYLLKSVIRNGKEEWFPIDKTSYCSTQAFEVASSIFEDIITYLETLNITVEQVHAETGKGQYEVVLGYTEASTAIISLIYAREVIKSVARQHGMMATFVPKYAEDEDGSGSHVHISLSRNGENVFMASGDSKYGMSKIGESFMAGVFNHLPAILAFTATHPLSAFWLQNFLALCSSDYYDGTIFHRNIKGFMIQGGDPTGTGKGGTSIWGKKLNDEIRESLKHNARGILSMANSGPNTNGSQFFITYAKQPHLNGLYTIFGKVIHGFEVLDLMEKVCSPLCHLECESYLSFSSSLCALVILGSYSARLIKQIDIEFTAVHSVFSIYFAL